MIIIVENQIFSSNQTNFLLYTHEPVRFIIIEMILKLLYVINDKLIIFLVHLSISVIQIDLNKLVCYSFDHD